MSSRATRRSGWLWLLASALYLACAQSRDVAVSDTPPPSRCTEDCSRASASQCYVGVCDEAAGACKVVPAANGTPCDDGLFCTVGETCNDGICGNAQPNLCGATDCLSAACNEAVKRCFVTPVADATPCAVKSDACTAGASCKSGECIAIRKDCSFAPGIDACHVGTCDPGTGACKMVPGNDFAPCSPLGTCADTQWCWKGVCQGGEIVYQLESSTDTSACHEKVCNPTDGTFTPKAIPIGQECGTQYECLPKTCVAGGTCQASIRVGASCNSVVDDCSVGTCNTEARCSPQAANEGAVCDDRDACTQASTCKMGACVGSLRSGVEVYFKDDFGGAFKWTAPADASAAFFPQQATSVEWQTVLTRQPEFDHTATMDQMMLACASCGVGAAVDSPVIDLSGAAGSVWLTVWSSLTQGQATTAFVTVFDGAKWVPVWSTPFDDMSISWTWSPIAVDVTHYKNKNFQIELGITDGDTAVNFTGPAWFIDDVTVASAPCAGPGAPGGGSGNGGG